MRRGRQSGQERRDCLREYDIAAGAELQAEWNNSWSRATARVEVSKQREQRE